MKKKIIQKKNEEFNEENTNNLYLPSTTKKKVNNNKSKESILQKSNILNENQNNILGLPKKKKNGSKNNIVNENSKISAKNSSNNLQKLDVANNDSQTKPKKLKNKINKKLKELKNIEEKKNIDKNVNILNKPKKEITAIVINEVKDKHVPIFSKNNIKIPRDYVFCIFRRKAYPYSFNSNLKIKDIIKKLSEELKIDKNYLEFRINDRIIKNIEEEKFVEVLIDEEKNDKIYVTKKYDNNNMINNLYNKTYNNLVIIENSFEIKEIEKKLNKFLEEYHMEKDYYFKKISDNKYSFGFSYADFAFDFNRLLLILKRTENDFKDIKSYLKLEKKKSKINLLSSQSIIKNNEIKMPSISYETIK